eukprot:1117640-Pelagomonas_calceolata.AAC.2
MPLPGPNATHLSGGFSHNWLATHSSRTHHKGCMSMAAHCNWDGKGGIAGRDGCPEHLTLFSAQYLLKCRMGRLNIKNEANEPQSEQKLMYISEGCRKYSFWTVRINLFRSYISAILRLRTIDVWVQSEEVSCGGWEEGDFKFWGSPSGTCLP